ncbi:MAG: sodium:solute symporter [Candidatus Omnitrophica bacterium]|nr:sodium:solute symporter [Candidatus Omnitrophota bacterium]
MGPGLAIGIVLGYFGILLLVSHFTSKDSSSNTFFIANRRSHWFLVSFGMIGAALSGISFISVPGEAAVTQFAYFQMVIGYVIGIALIAFVLLPLYYRLNVVSIYTFLDQRFGFWAYKTGAASFFIAQSVTSAFKLYLMATVLQISFFDAYRIPFQATVLITILLIWLYTFRSGIKTIVYTDILQTVFLLLSVAISIYVIGRELNLSAAGHWRNLVDCSRSTMFHWDWSSKQNFFKYIFTGAFMTVVTNGLDQSMMQKHLTCKTLRESQKNMFWFSVMLLFANLFILYLGLLLVQFAQFQGIPIPDNKDDLYPLLAIHHLNFAAGLFFLIGASAAAYSSSDSALTALTTSFCIDFLGFSKRDQDNIRKRNMIHLGVALYLYVLILLFHQVKNESIISAFIRASGYTYGPLLGLYILGVYTNVRIKGFAVPCIAVLSPAVSYLVYLNSEKWLWGYQFGYEILLLNAALTILGLVAFREKKSHHDDDIPNPE